MIRSAAIAEWFMKRLNGTIQLTDQKLIEPDFNRVLEQINPEACYDDIRKVIALKKDNQSEVERFESIDKWIETVLNMKTTGEIYGKEKPKVTKEVLRKFTIDIEQLMLSILMLSI